MDFQLFETPMTFTPLSSDVALLDVLRKQPGLSVTKLAISFEVTATAIRQRLTRLMDRGLVERSQVKAERGRPTHIYKLTEAGRRQCGSNFADLAVALWEEIRLIREPDVRKGLLARVSKRLAEAYSDQIEGETLTERMEAVSQLFAGKDIPFEVDHSGDLPVLTALACPYPELAEQDRSICAMERMLLSEMIGDSVKLNQCRLDGDTCCTFEASLN